MKLSLYLALLSPLLSLATAAALPGGGPTKDPIQDNRDKFEHAKAQCEQLRGGRREVCLRSLYDDRGPTIVLVTKGKGHAKRDDESGIERGDHDLVYDWLANAKMYDAEPVERKLDYVKKHERDEKEKVKRAIEVKADDNGVVDLAIPVQVSSGHTGSDGETRAQLIQDEMPQQQPSEPNTPPAAAPTPFFPPPTTLQTLPSPTPMPTTNGHLPPIEIDNAITFAPTTTYPVHRTLQTTTLANGTELRIEQTESDVHDVHVEETKHRKGDAEEDKVVVHVKVFVEHLRQQAGRAVKRALKGGLMEEKRGDGYPFNCHCEWGIFCFCGTAHDPNEDDDDSAKMVQKRDVQDVEGKEDVQSADQPAAMRAQAAARDEPDYIRNNCKSWCAINPFCNCWKHQKKHPKYPYPDDYDGWPPETEIQQRDVATTDTPEAGAGAADQITAAGAAEKTVGKREGPEYWHKCKWWCKLSVWCDCSQHDWDTEWWKEG